MSGNTDRNQLDDAVNQLQKYADAPRADFANLLGVNPDGKRFLAFLNKKMTHFIKF